MTYTLGDILRTVVAKYSHIFPFLQEVQETRSTNFRLLDREIIEEL